jgi:two-component system OmpR family response regulator
MPASRPRDGQQPAAPAAAAGVVLPPKNAGAAVLCDFEHKGLTLHEGSRSAAIHGVPLDLTRTQFDLLLVLMENGRVVQTKSDLVRRLRNEPYSTGSFVTAGEERAVEVHLGNLRKRLGDSSRSPLWIETVRGVGYRLAP